VWVSLKCHSQTKIRGQASIGSIETGEQYDSTHE
jgi:hypothetical protein